MIHEFPLCVAIIKRLGDLLGKPIERDETTAYWSIRRNATECSLNVRVHLGRRWPSVLVFDPANHGQSVMDFHINRREDIEVVYAHLAHRLHAEGGLACAPAPAEPVPARRRGRAVSGVNRADTAWPEAMLPHPMTLSQMTSLARQMIEQSHDTIKSLHRDRAPWSRCMHSARAELQRARNFLEETGHDRGPAEYATAAGPPILPHGRN